MEAIERAYRFVLSVLTGLHGDRLESVLGRVRYGSLPARKDCRLEMHCSGFLAKVCGGAIAELPEPPFGELEGIPIMFGEPVIERSADRIILKGDLVAGAYLLLTRYEEIARRDVRDRYGRFPGKESLPQRAGFLDRPLVDEYGRLLRRLLREAGLEIDERPRCLRNIYLTHDVDIPFRWHRVRPALRESVRRLLKGRVLSAPQPFMNYLGWSESDPNDCFNWMLECGRNLEAALGAERVHSLYFFLAGGAAPQDGMYELDSRHLRRLMKRILEGGAEIGLHVSFEAGTRPELVESEAARLRQISAQPIRCSRHHYLNCREPEDYRRLTAAGIAHDFTMAYADVAGFRVGTSRPYQWFDPVAMEETTLKIHPTTVMECTLDREQYMGLDYEAALSHTHVLVERTREHNGDLTLLWHNTELTRAEEVKGNYHRRLYSEVLKFAAVD